MSHKIRISELTEALEEFTKAHLDKGLKAIAFRMLTDHAPKFKAAGVSAKTIKELTTKGAKNKSTLKSLCALPFLNRELYEIWKTYIDSNLGKLWDRLIFEDYVGEHEVEDIYNLRMRNSYEGNGYSFEPIHDLIKAEFLILNFDKTGHWDEDPLMLSIPYPLRLQLYSFYDIPANAALSYIDKLPGKFLIFEKSDQVILNEVVRTHLYYKQDEIQVTVKNRPKLSTLNKMLKSLNLKEFFPNSKDKKLKTLRTGLLAGLFVDLQSSITITTPVEFVVQHLLKNIYFTKSDAAAIILNDLKGMNSLNTVYLRKINHSILDLLFNLSTSQWVSYENIYFYLQYHLVQLMPISPYTAEDKLHFEYENDDDMDWGYRHKNKHYIDGLRYHEAISIPFLKGTFFMLAALGIVEIAYGEPDRSIVGKSCQSAYDELKYVKLTPLGAYALDFEPSYTPTNALVEIKPVCSSEALTITLQIGDNSSGYILEPYANRVGPKRFATDTSTFLKGVKSKKDLTNKISMFREVSKIDFPQNWEDFFTDMLLKIDPFEKVAEQLLIFKLPQENKALIKLVAQDAVLKSYALKAEGFHILIPKSKHAAFKKRLLEFGYLLTK